MYNVFCLLVQYTCVYVYCPGWLKSDELTDTTVPAPAPLLADHTCTACTHMYMVALLRCPTSNGKECIKT